MRGSQGHAEVREGARGSIRMLDKEIVGYPRIACQVCRERFGPQYRQRWIFLPVPQAGKVWVERSDSIVEGTRFLYLAARREQHYAGTRLDAGRRWHVPQFSLLLGAGDLTRSAARSSRRLSRTSPLANRFRRCPCFSPGRTMFLSRWRPRTWLPGRMFRRNIKRRYSAPPEVFTLPTAIPHCSAHTRNTSRSSRVLPSSVSA